MKSSLRYLVMFLLVISAWGIIGCEDQRDSDGYTTYNSGGTAYPRYVTVDVYAYTSWNLDVYLGNAFVGSLQPGQSATFGKDLYDGEKLRMKFVVHNSAGDVTITTSFDDDYPNYHVNVYDNYVEVF